MLSNNTWAADFASFADFDLCVFDLATGAGFEADRSLELSEDLPRPFLLVSGRGWHGASPPVDFLALDCVLAI